MSTLSLKEQVAANKKAFAETGNLFGLEAMPRKAGDPGSYEALWHILSNLCDAAWETGCKVSSSPIAAEGGDALWALHLSTGEAVCISRGITAHPGLLAGVVLEDELFPIIASSSTLLFSSKNFIQVPWLLLTL